MEELFIDGKTFVSARSAAKEFGYAGDYLGQLIRAGKVSGSKVGRAWYVDLSSLKNYLKIADAPERSQEAQTAAAQPAPGNTGTESQVPHISHAVAPSSRYPLSPRPAEASREGGPRTPEGMNGGGLRPRSSTLYAPGRGMLSSRILAQTPLTYIRSSEPVLPPLRKVAPLTSSITPRYIHEIEKYSDVAAATLSSAAAVSEEQTSLAQRGSGSFDAEPLLKVRTMRSDAPLLPLQAERALLPQATGSRMLRAPMAGLLTATVAVFLTVASAFFLSQEIVFDQESNVASVSFSTDFSRVAEGRKVISFIRDSLSIQQISAVLGL